MPAPGSAWIVRPQPRAAPRLRLFCFPYSGGGTAAFRTWPAYLPPDVELCALQLPGRERRIMETPFDRLTPLVAALTDVLRPYLALPFAFFGHSMGAFVAFELARVLRSQGAPLPVHLFVSASRAPQLPPSQPLLYHLPDAAFLEELSRYNGTPAEILQNDEIMTLLLPMLRADFAVHDTYDYVPQAPLECPITAFGGWEDDIVPSGEIPPWREQTRAAFALQMFSGDHFFLREAEPALVGMITAKLSAGALPVQPPHSAEPAGPTDA